MVVTNIVLGGGLLLYILKSNSRSTHLMILIYLLFIFLYAMFAYFNQEVLIHPADESFFLDSALLVNSLSDSRLDIYANLNLLNLGHKLNYYGYVFLLSLVSFPHQEPDYYVYINLIVFQAILYAFFMAWMLKNKILNRSLFYLFIFPTIAFYSQFLYRDVFIAIIFFMSFLFFTEKKRIRFALSFLPLLIFRYQLFAYLLFSILCKGMFRLFHIRWLVISIAISSLLILVSTYNLHERFDIHRVFIAPLAINGEPFLYQLYIYSNGSNYYNSHLFRSISEVLASLMLVLFNAYFFSGLVSFKKTFSIKKPNEAMLNLSVITLFYFLSLISYLTINDGFSMRVKLAFIPVVVLALYRAGFNVNNYRFIKLCFLFLAIDSIFSILLIFKA